MEMIIGRNKIITRIEKVIKKLKSSKNIEQA